MKAFKTFLLIMLVVLTFASFIFMIAGYVARSVIVFFAMFAFALCLSIWAFASPAAWDHKSGAMDSLKESLGLYDDTIDG